MQILRTVLLLFASNCFMTIAWYGHLRFKSAPLWLIIVGSWGIAFFEYALQVPANRWGYGSMTAYQLKILQECITLCVFICFAIIYLGESFQIRYGISMILILIAVGIAFHQ